MGGHVSIRPEGTPPFWTLPAGEVLREVESSEAGLRSAEAAARLKRWGPNELAPPPRFEAIREIARYLANPLVLVLLLASSVSAALGQVLSSLVIALMLVLSIALNFAQAYRSQLAARRLREQVGHTATVVRDGVAAEISAREVVPGDVIHLAAGDLVPADARLLAAKDLFLNEALLTGESLPGEKHATGDGAPAALGGATTAVLRGTSVVSGVGAAVVVRTGASTEFGHIVGHLAARPPETEFERGTRRFGFLILEVVIFLVLLVFFVNALFRRDRLESFLFAVALAVGLTPELLPTQTLVIFVIRTAGRPWASPPSRPLVVGVSGCAAVGTALPFTPLAPWLGFTPLPPLFFGVLVVMPVTYLAFVEVMKGWFFRRYPV